MAKISSDEIREREIFARDEMRRDLKNHYDKSGKQVTGSAIEREVQQMQEQVARKKEHDIYKD